MWFFAGVYSTVRSTEYVTIYHTNTENFMRRLKMAKAGPALTYQFARKLVDEGILTGYEANQIRRIVLDFQEGEIPVMYIERFMDPEILNVTTALGGIEIRGGKDEQQGDREEAGRDHPDAGQGREAGDQDRGSSRPGRISETGPGSYGIPQEFPSGAKGPGRSEGDF
jgi:hypothetical protein